MSEAPTPESIAQTKAVLAACAEAGRLVAEIEAMKALPETKARLDTELAKFRLFVASEAAKAAMTPRRGGTA